MVTPETSVATMAHFEWKHTLIIRLVYISLRTVPEFSLTKTCRFPRTTNENFACRPKFLEIMIWGTKIADHLLVCIGAQTLLACPFQWYLKVVLCRLLLRGRVWLTRLKWRVWEPNLHCMNTPYLADHYHLPLPPMGVWQGLDESFFSRQMLLHPCARPVCLFSLYSKCTCFFWNYGSTRVARYLSTLSEPILHCLSISLIPRPQRAPAFHVSVVESNLRTPTNFTLFSALLSAGVAHRRHRYCGSAADSVGDHFCIKLCDCEMKSEYTRELARVYLFPGLSFTRMRRMS